MIILEFICLLPSIMHVLCTCNNRVAKEHFPLTMFETDNLYYYYHHLTVGLFQFPRPSSLAPRP